MELPRTYLFQTIEAERIVPIISGRVLLLGPPKSSKIDGNFFRRRDLYFPIFRGETLRRLDDLFLLDKRREIESWHLGKQPGVEDASGSSEINSYFCENKILDLLVNYVFPRLRESMAGSKDRLKLGSEKLSVPDAEYLRERFSEAGSVESFGDLEVFDMVNLSLAGRRVIDIDLIVMGGIAYRLADSTRVSHDIQVHYNRYDFVLSWNLESYLLSDLERSDRTNIESHLSGQMAGYNPKNLMKKLMLQRFGILKKLEEERFEDYGLFFKRKDSAKYSVEITVPAFALRVPILQHYVEIGQSQIKMPVEYYTSTGFNFDVGWMGDIRANCPTMHPLMGRSPGEDRICFGNNLYQPTGNISEDVAGKLLLAKAVFERGYDFADGRPHYRLDDLRFFKRQRISGLTVKKRGLVVTNQDA